MPISCYINTCICTYVHTYTHTHTHTHMISFVRGESAEHYEVWCNSTTV